MITNTILNPSAEGATASLAADTATAVAMVADIVTGPGARSYRLTTSSAGLAAAAVRAAERLPVTPGQRVWARARCRLDVGVVGPRKVTGNLVFRNASGVVLGHRQMSIGGDGRAVHRWLGAPYASASERLEYGVSRVNEITDPQFLVPTAWSRTAAMSYDFTYQGEVRVATTAAAGSATLVIFPAGALPASPGESKGARYVVTNTSPSASISLAGNTRAYDSAGASAGDGAVGAAVTIGPGESAPVVVPATVMPATAAGYRPLLRLAAALPVGVTFTISQPIAETTTDVPGAWFDGSLLNAGTSYVDQSTIDLVPPGVFYRFTGTPNASPSERIEGTTRILNAAPTPLNGQSSTNLAVVRSTLTLLPAENAVRATITDTAAGATAQRFNIGSPSAASTGAVRVSEGTRVSIQAGLRSTLPAMQMLALFYDSTATIIAGANQTSPNYPTTANAWNDVDFTMNVPAGAVAMLLYVGAGDVTTKTTSDTFDARLLYIGPPGARFDGNTPSTGTGNTQQVVEFVAGGDAPAGAVTADLMIYRDPIYQPGAADVLFVDSLLLARGTAQTLVTPPPFFAGPSTQYSAWTGTANASTSIYYETAPILTALTDDAPGPRVSLNFSELLPNTVTATVHRLTDQNDVVVPGADRASARGGLVRTDFYAPVLSPVRYIAEMFNEAGVSLGFTEAASTTIPTDPAYAYLMSPNDPKLQVRVEMEAEAGSTLRNPTAASVHEINGRRIVIAEGTYGLDGLPMPFWTDSAAAYRRALEVFLRSDNLVVFRVPPPMEIPRVLYAFGIPTRSETNLPGGVPDFLWDLTVQEVTPPTTQIITAQITYDRFRRYYSTYGAFKAAYATYLAAQLTPPPEV